MNHMTDNTMQSVLFIQSIEIEYNMKRFLVYPREHEIGCKIYMIPLKNTLLPATDACRGKMCTMD